jgi:peptidoglycan/LPS O-acetylase OafA/YrhL
MFGNCLSICARLFQGPSIASRAEGQNNNFNVIRLVAASLVVFSHCYPLSGHVSREPLALASGGFIDLGTVAVMAFFVISGFLISKSAGSSHSVRYFVAARFLRMWPGLLLSTLLVTLFLGPIATHWPLADFFSSQSTWRYLALASTSKVGAYLPGVFDDNPVPHGVNGSLWTILVEAWLYACMALLMCLGVARHKNLLSMVCLVAVLCFIAFPEELLPWMVRGDIFMTPSLVGCFILGILFYTNSQWIPLSPAIGLILLVVTALSFPTAWFAWLFYFSFAYGVLLLAFHPSVQLPSLNSRSDYSYGVYVFAFPIQQTIVSVLRIDNPLLLFAIAYPVILMMSALSWHYVESRALAWKVKFK